MKKCKKVKMNAGKNSFQELTEAAQNIMVDGEKLAGLLITCLSTHGSTREALITDTYAMAKTWAALLVIGQKVGVDITQMIDLLMPSFIDEVQAALDDVEQHPTPSVN